MGPLHFARLQRDVGPGTMKLPKPPLDIKSVGPTPEVICGKTSDYEKQPVRALLDLLMFFEPDGTQKHEFASRKLDRIPAHILPFIVKRLFRFADERKPVSLETAFGPLTGKQRNRILAEQRDRAILVEIWFHPKRIGLSGNADLSERDRTKIANLSAAEVNDLASKYRITPEAIRKIARKPFPGWGWDFTRQ